MKYPQNLIYPPHHPHELERRKDKCQRNIQRHTSLAVSNGLFGLFCLGIMLNFVQKDYSQKKDIVIPLIALFSSGKSLSISASSILKRKIWIREAHKLQKI